MKEIKLQEIEKFLESHIPPDKEIQLGPGVIVNNPKKFIETHLTILHANSKNARMMPYFLRLKKYYELMNPKNKKNE